MAKLENNNQFSKICFVSLSSYPLILNSNQEYLGGAEIQQVELANELIKLGFKIIFITYGNNHDFLKDIDGIKIISTYERHERSNLNFLKKSMIIWKRMKQVNSDIYIHRSGSPGIVTIFGLLHHKKVIKMVASNAEVTSKDIMKSSWILKYLEKIGNDIDFMFSDYCICQNEYQKSILEKKFNINCKLIKNAFIIPIEQNMIKKDSYILWIGTIRDVKRPEIFLEVARRLPQYNFLMIGGKGEDATLYDNIEKEVKKIKNLFFVGFVPHKEISKYYQKGILLINTSITEGFPNIFLEAWINKIPVISLDVDPDEVITKNNLGFRSGSQNQMIEDINLLMKNETLLMQYGKNARKYVEKNHNIKNIGLQYKELIDMMQKNKKK